MSLAPRHEPAWRVGDSLDRVLDAIRGRSSKLRAMPDGSYVTNCLNPGHPDRHPSLHVSHVDTEHGGRVLFKCFSDRAGCSSASQEDWASWAGLDYDDLFDDRRWSMHQRAEQTGSSRSRRQRRTGSTLGRVGPLPARIAHQLAELLELPPAAAPPLPGADHEHTWVHVQTYTYRDLAGHPVHRVIRQRCTHQGCVEKNFPQTYLRPGGDPAKASDWAGSKAKAGLGEDWRPVLYRWPQIHRALADGFPVWVLEGEKDVHTAEGIELVATTNPGGAGSFTAGQAAAFTGSASQINIVIDRDQAGRARGVTVHRLLTEAGVPAGQIRILLPAVTDPKADFTDHVKAGFTPDQLEPVTLAVLQAWVIVESTLAAATATVNTAQLEVDAQLQVSKHDRAAGRKAAAADRTRYAARWAKEAVRAHTQLADAAAHVITLTSHVPAADPHAQWARESVEVALTHLRTTTGLVRDMYAQTGQLLPTNVEQQHQLVTAAATGAAEQLDDHGEPGDSGAETTGRVALELIRGGGGGGQEPRIHIEHDHFELLGGELVQARWRTLSNGDRVRSYTRIINTEITLAAREFAELDEDIEADNIDLDQLGDRDGRERATTIRNLPTVSHVVVTVPDGQGGTAKIRVPFDDYETGSFLSHLPVRGLNYSRSRSGRDKVITAITYVSDDVEHLTSYRATGWRRRADNTWMYIMSGGAIDAHGYQPVPTNLTGVMARFDLPNPTCDPARLRQAFASAAAPMMDRFPDRIGAVLIGQAFRASLCANPWVTVLSGSPATGKTGLSAIAQHF